MLYVEIAFYLFKMFINTCKHTETVMGIRKNI